MDPFSAHAIATTRSADLVREAEESRVSEAARRSREDERPVPERTRRRARARWPSVAR